MKATLIQPYLFFGGRCEEALEFYRINLGAQVEVLMHYRDSLEPQPPGMLAPGYENKVMHATFRIGVSTLMASDGCGEPSSFAGFSLSLALPTEAEANRTFAALAEGGQVKMPLTKTFWSPRFGMLTDRFGLGWMVSVEASTLQKSAMQFMMLMIPAVYQGGKKVEPEFAPDSAKMEEMGKFNEELGKAVKTTSLNGLHPLATGARVAFGKGKPIVTDGPAIEAKEVLGGYWLVEAKSKEELVAWAQRCPADPGDVIEIRQIWDEADLPK